MTQNLEARVAPSKPSRSISQRIFYGSLGTLALTVIASVAITYYSVSHRPSRQQEVELVGEPMSVETSYGPTNHFGFSAVVRDVHGRNILVNADDTYTLVPDYMRDAAVLIRSEISDTDAEPVTFHGVYNGQDRFRFREVRVQDQTVRIDYHRP
ncbi:MAG: hypothetical protein Q8R37_04890 [Nanoarchaeota archaeon]|nr:hypothetical protein [Nanoarchaeota archaeon]